MVFAGTNEVQVSCTDARQFLVTVVLQELRETKEVEAGMGAEDMQAAVARVRERAARLLAQDDIGEGWGCRVVEVEH